MTRSIITEVSEASEDYEAVEINEVDEATDFNLANEVDEATDFTLNNEVDEAMDFASNNEVDEFTDITVLTVATEFTKDIESTNNPKYWPSRKKNLILSIVAILGTVIIITSKILYPALITLRKEFDTSEVASIVCAAYSDRFATRRKVLLLSMIVFIIPSILCTLANRIWQLLILTAIQACGSSSSLSMGAGIISDIYFPKDRGFAYGIFSLAPATIMGTASGDYIIQYLNWRWIYYSLALYGGSIFLLILFFIPETCYQIKQRNTTKNTKKKFNPCAPLKLLGYPNFILIAIYMDIVLSMIVLQSISAARNFSSRSYNLAPSSIGLLYLAPTLGGCFGGVFGASFGTYIVYNSLSPYLVDVCPSLSASAIALSECIRFIMAGTFSVFGSLLEDSLGTGWYYTLISSLCLLPTFFLVLVYFNGNRWKVKFFREN
ncbi:MFS general substrate transporter [Gigaspora margarita]|uniref:MFS general substrate transporter n=1 Tax=Gigaspora margarita TaxID=4874 RepID=A0A8H3XK17_GIGMA|nr:MFS general substrate transporter [Gigaspora margarita]